MDYTQNYNLKKPEGNEYADNDPLNENFDNIDNELKKAQTPATPTLNGAMSKEDKSKLDGIAYNANKYIHPNSHNATMINQDSTHRFVSDTEKAAWNGKADKSAITDGTLKANTDRLQGKPISTMLPTENQILKLISGVWTPKDSTKVAMGSFTGSSTVNTGLANAHCFILYVVSSGGINVTSCITAENGWTTVGMSYDAKLAYYIAIKE